MKLVKDDKVMIRTGKDRGKSGKILRVLPKENRIVVEGINLVKKHAKPTSKLPHGGIITREAPIAASNVMLACPECSKPTKVRKQVTDAGIIRVCTECGAALNGKKRTK